MRSKKWTYIIHISAWLLFFSLPVALRFVFLDNAPKNLPPPPNLKDIDSWESFLTLFFITSSIVTFYYLNSNVLIIKLLLRKKVVPYTLSILACYLLFVYNFKPLVTYVNPNEHIFPPPEIVKVVSKLIATLIFLFVLLVSTGIRLTIQWYDTEKKRVHTEKEKAEAELSFLKAQINPHFLFNTLNSIYTLAIKQSEKTPEAVMHLSNMMRFVTTEAQSTFVSLEQELQYIEHFIDLQKLRLPRNITVNSHVDSDNLATYIAPLLLMPFIENAFKYGISTRETGTIDIAILVKKGVLLMTVQNQKFKTINEEKDKTGIGLENTKKRLEMLYTNRYTLEMNDLEKIFFVKLELTL